MLSGAGPKAADLGRDGWTIVDAERAYHDREGVYWVPPSHERRGIPPGALAKLLFIWAKPGPGDPTHERMWVEVVREEKGRYLGRLANEPYAGARPIGEGANVWFGPEHVIDLCVPGGKPLSEKSHLVRCQGHGWSEPCWVCVHVAEGTGLGFNEGGDPGRLRPDAWCDQCDKLLEGKAAWDDSFQPPIKLVCGACYDEHRRRNRRDREPA